MYGILFITRILVLYCVISIPRFQFITIQLIISVSSQFKSKISSVLKSVCVVSLLVTYGRIHYSVLVCASLLIKQYNNKYD